jgi:hypothetical protein
VASNNAWEPRDDRDALQRAIFPHAGKLESCAEALTGTYRFGQDLVLGPVQVVLDLDEKGGVTDQTRSKTSAAFLAPVADCILRTVKEMDFSQLRLRAPHSMPVVVDVDCQAVDKGRVSFAVKCSGKYREI